ncbi:MAG: tRNA dihydrouridine synthase DusB [Clostridia bacterium]|nr:tRNA dihydrouridine synthase DusB [Clostridia bacterium]
MKIGSLEVSGYAALAPMAGVADRAMRELCISYGASFCISELVSSKGVSMGDRKSKELMSVYEKERPMAVQLFGCEPDIMVSAAKIAASQNPDFLDINMGCPAPKVAGNGGGSALMKDPVLAGDIVKAVVSATELPVTVKIRTGWDENNITALEVAKRCEDAGAAAVTVHGRTRTQMYAPPVNLDIIKSVKEALAIPVIANGDIDTPEKAKAVYEYTGCDFLMVGRAAMGAPWIFSQINAYLKDGTILPEPSLEEKLNTLLLQVKMMAEYKNERTAILESRKHASWYLKGMRGAAAFRRMCGEIDSFTDLEKLCNSVKEMQNNA